MNGPRRRVRYGALESGRIVVLLALCGLASHAWPQQATLPSPILVADAAIPEAPEAQAPAAQQLPQPAPGSVHGVVVDREGTVYEGAHIALEQTAYIPPSVRAATSDSNGRFNFAGVSPGAFNLTISSTGFATQIIAGFLHAAESYEAQPVVLLVTAAESEVAVTASQQEIAQEQIREEEQQRVLGIIPNFFVSYAPDAPPLTSRQKFHLAFKSSVDPFTFMSTAASAGLEQADNSFSAYGQGAEGYAKRYAANYADNFIGTMIGSALLPSLLKQDPRYFYKGTETTRSRVFYAIANSVMCKSDKGRWQPNYSAIIASFAAAGISNLYYPAANRDGMTLTFENILIGKATGAAQNIFQEFFIRKLTRRIPDYGGSNP